MLALTRKIFADEAGEDSVEDVFARAQQVMAKAEALLVDAGWSAPKPVAVEVTARWRQRSRRRLRSPAVALLRGHSDPERE